MYYCTVLYYKQVSNVRGAEYAKRLARHGNGITAVFRTPSANFSRRVFCLLSFCSQNLNPTTNTKLTVTTRNAFGDAWVTKFGHGHEHECIKATSCTKFERAKAPLLSSFIPLEPRSSPLHTSVVLLFSSSEQIFMARRRMAQEHYCEGAETLHFASEAPLILSLEESRASIDCLDSCSEDSLRSFLSAPRIRCVFGARQDCGLGTFVPQHTLPLGSPRSGSQALALTPFTGALAKRLGIASALGSLPMPNSYSYGLALFLQRRCLGNVHSVHTRQLVAVDHTASRAVDFTLDTRVPRFGSGWYCPCRLGSGGYFCDRTARRCRLGRSQLRGFFCDRTACQCRLGSGEYFCDWTVGHAGVADPGSGDPSVIRLHVSAGSAVLTTSRPPSQNSKVKCIATAAGSPVPGLGDLSMIGLASVYALLSCCTSVTAMAHAC